MNGGSERQIQRNMLKKTYSTITPSESITIVGIDSAGKRPRLRKHQETTSENNSDVTAWSLLIVVSRKSLFANVRRLSLNLGRTHSDAQGTLHVILRTLFVEAVISRSRFY